MRLRRASIASAELLLLWMVWAAVGVASPIPPIIHKGRHTLVGELERVDAKGKRITIKTADGAEHVVSYTSRTIVHGLAQGGRASYLAGKQGSQVVVHYTERGATTTADQVDVFGHNALKSTDGTLVSVNQRAHTVVIRSADGAEHTYSMGRGAVVDTTNGVIDRTDLAARKGDHVIVYHTERGKQDVVHAVKDLASKF
jgi:uncharacterized protein YjhX (UPF0386 family)